MNIAIYQVDMERDTNRIAFMSYENLERFQGSQEIDCKIYDKVFEGEIDCKSLEEIYRKFNLDHPKDYVGRSLSVSDVVEIKNSDTSFPGFYFCDDFGFKEVQFDKSLCPKPSVSHSQIRFPCCSFNRTNDRSLLKSAHLLKQCKRLSAEILRNICPLKMMLQSSVTRKER